uniref:Uncharacterized protein n=1 Tax=Tetranychus urticae TaxID=32264 RepID=T1KI25_TETUR
MAIKLAKKVSTRIKDLKGEAGKQSVDTNSFVVCHCYLFSEKSESLIYIISSLWIFLLICFVSIVEII